MKGRIRAWLKKLLNWLTDIVDPKAKVEESRDASHIGALSYDVSENNPDGVRYDADARPADCPERVDYDALFAKLQLERLEQDTKGRRYLTAWMAIVVTLWLVAVLLITVANNYWCFEISDTVLVTLLATTTLNVLGLSKIILSGLFGEGGKKEEK